MKSPAELARKLARQWEYATLRESRLLDEPDAWPVSLPIGKPPPAAILNRISDVRKHFAQWRSVTLGEVTWREANYRSTLDAVSYPAEWIIPDAATWIRACADRTVANEFKALTNLLAEADPTFRRLLIRRRALWRERDPAEVEQALRLALQLQPGCAEGRPLRALPLAGNDTKFFERNESLLLSLLDLRFDGEATLQGLEPFLGAHSDRGHWLLIIDLDGDLLPFDQIRLRASKLNSASLPGDHLIIIENEACQHMLPPLPGTIAVLGTGFDLTWTVAPWLHEKRVAYWGDLDTWGIELLGRARKSHPHLEALMMTRDVFETNQQHAVPEKTPVETQPHPALTVEESELFLHLRNLQKGRLEQEFLPGEIVKEALQNWRAK